MIMRIILFLLLMGTVHQMLAQDNNSPEALAQRQLDAYNIQDLDAFLACYHDSVRVYNFPDQLRYVGKEKMEKTYGPFFENTPDLHCELVNRIVEGNTVIDHEKVTVNKNQPPFNAIAIYKIKEGKIAEVYFTQ